MSASFHRCGHCRGFYEVDRSACRYCGKSVPMKDAAGNAKVYPDRATCRAIQIAEFEQLPKEAHEDPMRPDPEVLDKRCSCLHCPQDAEPFEAVEMRWMANENMWACPCTTCGGRGFGVDIHISEPMWQCVDCHHWYPPANGIRYASNARCPKCGCTMANGWFEDEPMTAEEEAALMEKYKDLEERIAREEIQPFATPEELEELGIPASTEDRQEGGEVDYPFPTADDDDDEGEEWKGESSKKEPSRQMPDDIDFPREFRKREKGEDFPGMDDIPW
jgi:hypothetical protein